MPLIVPGVTANNLGDGETQEWLQKLVGKTLTDGNSSETAFSKKDLPKQARVVLPGQIMSKDHEPKRLNVILAQDGTVENVYHG